MNSANSTKQRPSVSKGPISRICRLLLALGLVKLALLGSLILLPVQNSAEENISAHVAPAFATAKDAAAEAAAEAARGERTLQAVFESKNMAWPAEKNAAQEAATENRPETTRQAVPKEPKRLSGVAYAAENVPMPVPNIAPMASPVSPETVIRPDDAPPAIPPAPSVAPLPSRDSAQEKQAEFNRREQELLNLQQQMEARVKELNTLENRVQGMLKDANKEQDSKMQHLVETYANMKPRQAAQVLATLDERIAVKILSGLKSKQAGEIFSYMNPARAAVLSELLSKMQLQ